MTKPLILDTKDDRREIWHLLHRLPPHDRIAFIAWCCDRVKNRKHNPRPDVAKIRDRIRASVHGDDVADEWVTNECYADFWMLCVQYGLDSAVAGVQLEKVVRRKA